MKKTSLIALFVLFTLYSCKKDGTTKQEPVANADIAGSFRLTTYTRSDTREYTATELPCLLNTVFIIKTNSTTAAYSENGKSCFLTPIPPDKSHITLGGGTDTARSTYTRSGNDLTFTFKTGSITRVSNATLSTINGKLTLIINSTINETFSGVPLNTILVFTKQ